MNLSQLPGAPERTATLTGPMEQSTQIDGFWKSKFLGATTETAPFLLDNQPVTTARDAVKTMDSVRLLGQLLEVTWLDTLRRGHLRRFEQKWHTSEDVEFSIVFEWVSRGEPTAPAVLISDTSVGDAFADVSSLFDFLDQIPGPNVPLLDELINQLQAFTNGINDLVLGIEDAVISFTDKVLTPVRAIRGLATTLQSLEDETALMLDFLMARPASAFSSKPVDDQSYSEKQSLALYREELRAWAAALQRAAVEQRTGLLQQVSGTLLATYVARGGEDLRDVAKQFYGTPFEWRRLLIFNDLDTPLLEAGQVVLVPPLSVDQAGQEAPGT